MHIVEHIHTVAAESLYTLCSNIRLFTLVAICSADEQIRLVRLLRYSNKQTRDK
jgi:hypothetical protein